MGHAANSGDNLNATKVFEDWMVLLYTTYIVHKALNWSVKLVVKFTKISKLKVYYKA